MPRTTRKQNSGRRQLRLTRRATALSQVGGAVWYVISDDERKATWASVLGSGPLSFLVGTSDWRSSADAMKRYGMLLAHQDYLLQGARQCMMKSAGITDTTPAPEVLTKIKTINRNYLNDVLALVAFSDEGPRTSKNTSLVDLSNNILDCILFPKRVENLLIYAIASVIVQFHKTPSLLQEAQSAEALKTILERQCRAYYKQLVYEQTANDSPYSFYMRQTLDNARIDRSAFWLNFLNACITPPSTNTRLPTLEFYNIAAGVYHNRTAADIVSAVFTSIKGPAKVESDLKFTAAPDLTQWNKNITNTVTYKQFLLDGYRPRHIEFLFHLAYTVQKILGETGGLPAAAAATPSSGAETGGSNAAEITTERNLL